MLRENLYYNVIWHILLVYHKEFIDRSVPPVFPNGRVFTVSIWWVRSIEYQCQLHEVKGTSSPQFITRNLILKAFRLGKQIKESVWSTNKYKQIHSYIMYQAIATELTLKNSRLYTLAEERTTIGQLKLAAIPYELSAWRHTAYNAPPKWMYKQAN